MDFDFVEFLLIFVTVGVFLLCKRIDNVIEHLAHIRANTNSLYVDRDEL